MVTQKYMEGKIREFEQQHQYRGYLTNNYDKEIIRRWKDEQARKDQKWRAINNYDDVVTLINRYDNIVASFEKADRGFYEDGFDMALALYDALQGLRKMAQFIEPKPWNTTKFTQVSEKEADALFARLDGIALRMSNVNLRRAMSD